MRETLIKRKLEEKGREIVLRTRGSSHGPITRLVSPSDVGQAIKPFVFLDYFSIDPKRMPAIGFHPHSGIEIVTVVLQGQLSYQETSGTEGVIDAGGVEWMHAGGGVLPLPCIESHLPKAWLTMSRLTQGNLTSRLKVLDGKSQP